MGVPSRQHLSHLLKTVDGAVLCRRLAPRSAEELHFGTSETRHECEPRVGELPILASHAGFERMDVGAAYGVRDLASRNSVLQSHRINGRSKAVKSASNASLSSVLVLALLPLDIHRQFWRLT